MKINKHLFGIAALSIAFTLTVGLMVNVNASRVEVVAEQHIDNYAPYTYVGSYYDDIHFDYSGGMNGNLREEITALSIPTKFYTYSGSKPGALGSVLQSADQDPNNSNNMLMFYTRNSVTKVDSTTSSINWDREHVWCQSHSNDNWGKDKGGVDVLHLRPTYPGSNRSRGDKKYGDVHKTGACYIDPVTKQVTTDTSKLLFGYSDGEYFEPIDAVKGDVARIIMYLWTTYTGYDNYAPLNILDIFSNYNTLIQWHTQDRPDAMEGYRNNFAEQSEQKNRNPFVDHPELAWKIFGDAQGLSDSVKNACMTAYPDGNDPIEPTGITLDKTIASVELNQTLQLNATLTPNGATGVVTWSSDNASIASVNNNGLVTGNTLGSAIITASIGTYSASCTVTVTEVSENYGTLESPLCISDAIEVIRNGGDQITTNQMYVRGIVSSNTVFNTQYNNFSEVWLQSDDGKTSKAFELYRVMLDPSITDDYSAANSLIGKEVIAYGYGQKYNSTYELGPVNNAQNPTILVVTTPIPAEKTAKELIEESVTTSALSYHYSKDGDEDIVDTLDKAFTGVAGNNYSDWSNDSDISGVSYVGQSAAGNNAIQLRSSNSNSGIVVSANTVGHNATKVVVSWNSNTASGRTIDVYGKNSAYTSPTELYDNATKGTKIGSIVYGTSTTLIIDDEYQYIGIRSNSNALYADSIKITWGEKSYTYAYSNISIRFGAFINDDLWTELEEDYNILGYGVTIADNSLVKNNEHIKDYYLDNNGGVTDHYMPKEEKAKPSYATDNQKGELEGQYLIWNLKQMIDFIDATKTFVAAAYIKTETETIFLNQVRYSVKSLANDYINNRGYQNSVAEGSLLNLANLSEGN